MGDLRMAKAVHRQCQGCWRWRHTDDCRRCQALIILGNHVMRGLLVSNYLRSERYLLDTLDGVAAQLTERATMAREFRRAMFDEQRDGQRAAREAYQQGRWDEIDTGVRF